MKTKIVMVLSPEDVKEYQDGYRDGLQVASEGYRGLVLAAYEALGLIESLVVAEVIVLPKAIEVSNRLKSALDKMGGK